MNNLSGVHSPSVLLTTMYMFNMSKAKNGKRNLLVDRDESTIKGQTLHTDCKLSFCQLS